MDAKSIAEGHRVEERAVVNDKNDVAVTGTTDEEKAFKPTWNVGGDLAPRPEYPDETFRLIEVAFFRAGKSALDMRKILSIMDELGLSVAKKEEIVSASEQIRNEQAATDAYIDALQISGSFPRDSAIKVVRIGIDNNITFGLRK